MYNHPLKPRTVCHQEDDYNAPRVVLLRLLERGTGGDHGAIGAADHQGAVLPIGGGFIG